MKQLLLMAISLLAISACTPQPSPPPASMAQPVSYAAGSPDNTTRAFDGAYTGDRIQNMSAGRTTVECPNFNVAPALTIRNGLAQFKALDLTFQGYVTPQGGLKMQAERGQVFEGSIDPYYVLRGRVTGYCAYDTSWKRSQMY